MKRVVVLRRRSLLGAAILGGLAAACKRAGSSDNEVTLAAAASLRSVVPALIEAFKRRHPNVQIRASYGASGDLRKRVIDGAGYDAVMFASGQPVDDLVGQGLVERASRRVVASNDLVLIAPKDQAGSGLSFATIDRLAEPNKLAIGDPGAVPAGQYARDAFIKLGKWDGMQGRVVFGGDVAAVLAYARRGEVAAAVVYATEVRGIEGVVILDRATGSWAPKPEVVVGVVAGAPRTEQARSFLEFVASEAGLVLFKESGFGAPR